MASRQEEKERRRQERLEREEAGRKGAARKKRLQYVVGGCSASPSSAASWPSWRGRRQRQQRPRAGGAAATPPRRSSCPSSRPVDLKAAAKAAGCTLAQPADRGPTHETKDFKASDYKTNPPTSGNHNPDWYEDGVYNPGDTPNLGKLVHPLEHGRIDVQYKPGTPAGDVAKLQALLPESDGYHMLMFQNTTNMPGRGRRDRLGPLGHLPGDERPGLRRPADLPHSYIDKGPEAVP